LFDQQTVANNFKKRCYFYNLIILKLKNRWCIRYFAEVKLIHYKIAICPFFCKSTLVVPRVCRKLQ